MSAVSDFDVDQELPPEAGDLVVDIGLDRLFDVMGGGDDFLRAVAVAALLARGGDVETVRYRQGVLRDCLENREVVMALYRLAEQAATEEKRSWGFFYRSPNGVLSRSVMLLDRLTDHLLELRRLAEPQQDRFTSEGFCTLFESAQRELDDDYVDHVKAILDDLGLQRGLLIGAQLGRHNRGVRQVLHRPPQLTWRDRLLGDHRDTASFRIASRDESGSRMLEQLRDRGVAPIARAAVESAGHLIAFFVALRAELGFYVAALNLHDALTSRGQPASIPDVSEIPSPLRFEWLYDPALALVTQADVVGNDFALDQRSPIVVTGANQGGKSTFLRSLGAAHLLMRAGLFVPARRFAGELRPRVFSHFKQEEDETMRSGKLDEELARMQRIVDQLDGRSLLLLNESFASTNEREGSEIALQLLRALHEAGVRVAYVTHMYDLARRVQSSAELDPAFLRAGRADDGSRPFRLVEAPALPTSYGPDTYKQVFGLDLISPESHG